MKRILLVLIAIFVASLLLSARLNAASFDGDYWASIRGGVYEDVDGDGQCTAGVRPVPNVDIRFELWSPAVTLYTGSDGTYGLVGIGTGTWRVTVQPDPNEWSVTSANPLIVPVNLVDGLVQTDVNFCVQRSRPAFVTARLAQLTSYTKVMADITASGVTDLPAISEALLTTRPGPAPTSLSPGVTVKPAAEDAPPAAVWLAYLNQFRDMGGLTPLQEDEALTRGSQLHSRYMVVNDRPIAHAEDPANPLYDPAGHQAARNGNIFATSQFEADHVWAINFWISAPFHLVPMIDPELGTVGFGRYNQEVGTFHMAAVLDVRSALGNADAQPQYPLFFPGDGAETWVVRHSLYEWPDPTSSCTGYARPTGAPIILQLGSGDGTPSVTSYALRQGGRLLETCLFHENSYANPDPFAQRTGRIILNERDAIVLLPRRPLAIGQTYDVEIVANGQTYAWSFTTRKSAP